MIIKNRTSNFFIIIDLKYHRLPRELGFSAKYNLAVLNRKHSNDRLKNRYKLVFGIHLDI